MSDITEALGKFKGPFARGPSGAAYFTRGLVDAVKDTARRHPTSYRIGGELRDITGVTGMLAIAAFLDDVKARV